MNTFFHIFNTFGASAPAPVWLIIEDPQAATGATSGGWSFITLTLTLLVLCLLAASVLMTVRRRLGRPLIRPEELAFQALSRRLCIGRRGRRQVRTLAALIDDAPPVALLLSERACRMALNRAPVAGVEVDALLIARLEQRIFSAR
ncbi:MAG: hypothetical protein EA376_11490 [Phycisphaeraceae bacterium]|nr:MAG: hypothetical protein EA376_11490 [Phycisphaeraceae bacterium]